MKVLLLTLMLLPLSLQSSFSQDIPRETLAKLEHKAAPKYPDYLQRNGITGHGVYELHFNDNGGVREVVVVQSTGNETLDRNAVHTLQGWKAKPHSLHTLRVPIHFGETVHRKPNSDGYAVTYATADNVVSMFTRTWKPVYPYEARRARIQGRGWYRMYINPDGTVTRVGVLKSTGSEMLDVNAANGLIHWRAKPGTPKEVDIPITFSLRGTN